MAYLDGANVILGAKVATTFGTPTAIGANDKLEVDSFNHGENAGELSANPIGSGDSMQNESQRGAVAPAVSWSKKLNFAGADGVCLAALMGTANVAGPGTGGYYHHSILFNETQNAKYITHALLATTASVIEYATCAPIRAVISAQDVPNYTQLDMDFIANQQSMTSATNTPATIVSATLQDTERVVAQPQSTFRINTQAGGALASGDVKAILSASFEFDRSQEMTREIRGSAGLGAPISTGDIPFMAGITVTFRNLDDVNWLLDHQSGKEFKCDFKVESSSTANKFFEISIPRCKIVQSPEWNLSSTTNNPLTVTFKVLKASSSPTGMIDSYPYFRFANSRSTGFLA